MVAAAVAVDPGEDALTVRPCGYVLHSAIRPVVVVGGAEPPQDPSLVRKPVLGISAFLRAAAGHRAPCAYQTPLRNSQARTQDRPGHRRADDKPRALTDLDQPISMEGGIRDRFNSGETLLARTQFIDQGVVSAPQPPSPCCGVRAATGPTIRSKSAFEPGLPWIGTCVDTSSFRRLRLRYNTTALLFTFAKLPPAGGGP
jgi:hypothetical protein